MHKATWKTFNVKTGLMVLAAVMLSCASAGAGQNDRVATVYAVGSSSLRGADMSAGRSEAVADSLVVAVTQVLSDLMPPQTMEGYFQVLSESIFSRTEQFIADYQMLTEATHASTHRVMVKATVSVRRLKDALKQSGIYIGQKEFPRLLFCIAEKQVNDMGYRYWWSGQSSAGGDTATAAMEKPARDKGFVLVAPRVDASATAYPPELSVPEAVALGQRLQAEVVVTGQAVAEELPNTMGANMRSFRATVAVRAYNVGNGAEIGRSQQMEVVTGDDPGLAGRQAVGSAASTAGKELSTQIASAWFSMGGGSSKIELQVDGISGHIADFVKLRGAVSTMSGVESIQRKEMQSNTAVLLVDYQGSTRTLADALMKLDFDAFGLNITDTQGNTIQLQIVPRQN